MFRLRQGLLDKQSDQKCTFFQGSYLICLTKSLTVSLDGGCNPPDLQSDEAAGDVTEATLPKMFYS